jgi:hypothetical protein
LIDMAGDPTTKRFERPVMLLRGGDVVEVASVEEAVETLANVSWPERGPRHRDAYETCLKALDGHRSAADARAEFLEAAREAGIPIEE